MCGALELGGVPGPDREKGSEMDTFCVVYDLGSGRRSSTYPSYTDAEIIADLLLNDGALYAYVKVFCPEHGWAIAWPGGECEECCVHLGESEIPGFGELDLETAHCFSHGLEIPCILCELVKSGEITELGEAGYRL